MKDLLDIELGFALANKMKLAQQIIEEIRAIEKEMQDRLKKQKTDLEKKED